MLTLQDVIKIQADEKKYLQDIKERLANTSNKIDALFVNPKSILRFKEKQTMDGHKRMRYNILNEEYALTCKQIEKQEILLAYIDEHIANIKKAIAYNYYVEELQRRPKMLNKPLHYKRIREALNDIYYNMPEDIKIWFYDLQFRYNNGYKCHDDLTTYNYKEDSSRIDSKKLKKIEIEILDPIEIFNNNYDTYYKIFEILQDSYNKISALEKTLVNAETMQYNKGSMLYQIECANRYLPLTICREFKRGE